MFVYIHVYVVKKIKDDISNKIRWESGQNTERDKKLTWFCTRKVTEAEQLFNSF